MRIDRATARRIAEALRKNGDLSNYYAIFGVDSGDLIDVILRASAPAKPPGRTKRGKGKR